MSNKGGDPYRARRWREAGTGDTYAPEALAGEADEDPTGYPTNGTVAEVLAWVGTDAGRAGYALDAEHRRPSPRHGVLTPVGRIT